VSDNLRQQLAQLPEYLGAHVAMVGAALLIGICLSLPLGVVSARSRRVGWSLLSVASVIQTIPSLALLALMVPLLGSFGFLPALVALVLYSMLPVLRNTAVGIKSLDPSVTEAAVAVGMTPSQVLRQVELPLALPTIVAGVRTATVWVVGIATLSTPVGQTSLGNFIFSGLQTRNWASVLVGCVAAAGLALVLDGLLGLVERGLRTRSRPALIAATSCIVLVFTAGLGAPSLAAFISHQQNPDVGAPTDPKPEEPSKRTNPDAPPAVRIGAKTFTEQYILARLIEIRLKEAGFSTELVESLGSTVAFDALRTGQLDVYVDYTGTLYTNGMKRTDAPPSWRVSALVSEWLASRHGIRLLGSLGFENAYAIAMRRDRAAQLGIVDIADLAEHAQRLKLGSDYEFFQRPEWRRLRSVYSLRFEELVSFDSSFMYAAVRDGKVDAITAFSSDGRIAAFELSVLTDSRRAFPPYDAVILLGPARADDARVARALLPLVDAISADSMRRANWQVDRDQPKRTPRQAAEWLSARIEAD
jgi:osmoprotectant transport system permease protein